MNPQMDSGKDRRRYVLTVCMVYAEFQRLSLPPPRSWQVLYRDTPEGRVYAGRVDAKVA